jgi:hypothetical protein
MVTTQRLFTHDQGIMQKKKEKKRETTNKVGRE